MGYNTGLIEIQVKDTFVPELNYVPRHENIPGLTKHYATNMYWGVKVQLCAFFISALDGGEWSTSRPGRLTSGERDLGTHCIGVWVGS